MDNLTSQAKQVGVGHGRNDASRGHGHSRGGPSAGALPSPFHLARLAI